LLDGSKKASSKDKLNKKVGLTGNVLTASDVLLTPVQQDIFNFQALQYQLEKLTDFELDEKGKQTSGHFTSGKARHK
jgi:hypothetical protein